jgi:hypothetical protein
MTTRPIKNKNLTQNFRSQKGRKETIGIPFPVASFTLMLAWKVSKMILIYSVRKFFLTVKFFGEDSRKIFKKELAAQW